ncbi:MAG TPA: nucleotidyltransferase family protein [Candidatus Pacearchaeota archaeon]|nr:nucleotidyltransferase family protein [Candidatus Pacearchaeota archaeon]
MKSVILCAGYATRMYPLTENKAKPLLPVGDKPILDHTMDKIPSSVEEVIVISNDKFYNDFLEWSKKYGAKVKILNDGSVNNETRLGGIGDLWLAIEKEGIDDDILLILGDNLFDFDLKEVVDFFNKEKKDVVVLHDVKDLEEAKKFGVMQVEDNKIVSFEEKPESPKSTLVSTGIYLFSKDTLKKIKKYIESGGSKEGPGYLIPYIMKTQDIYALILEGRWHDIGSKETYEKVNQIYDLQK